MKLRMIEIKETKSATTDSNVRIISEKTSKEIHALDIKCKK